MVTISSLLTFIPIKQRIVSYKTTCRFLKNNVSFLIKQRVVSCKTSCSFSQTL